MSDNINDDPTSAPTDDVPGETPLQKALRVKKAALDAREKPPRGGRFQREQAARVATGASRPWMKK